MTDTNTSYTNPYRNSRIERDAQELKALMDAQNPTQGQEQNPGIASQATSNNQTHTTGPSENTDEATYQHRWKNLKKYHDTEIYKERQRVRELEQQLEETRNVRPPKTAEELEEFRNSNPELFGVVETVAQMRAKEFGTAGVQRITELETRLAEASAEKAMVEVERKHPDFASILSSPQFDNWLENQDMYVQGMVRDNADNSAALIRAIDLYKHDNSVMSAQTSGQSMSNTQVYQPQQTAAQAVSVRGNSVQVGTTNQRIWTGSEINAMRPEEFKALEAEIMEAYAEGRVTSN